MSDTTVADDSAVSSHGLYRAVWRWHFYAGLFVLPFLILLAVTGGIYLLKDEINDILHPKLRLVEPLETAVLPASDIVARAIEAAPGELKGYAPPPTPDRAAQVKISTPEAGKQVVYVNPYNGEVLGQLWDGGFAGSPFMWVVRKIHSLEYFGWVANRIIELVGCWAIVLVVTGFYLWWPRGQNGGMFSVRFKSGRTFWRDLHAVTGAYAGIAIGFLALSGLPWSGYWGGQFYQFANSSGLGMPPGYWSDYPLSTVPAGEVMDHTPWAMEKEPLPVSEAAEGAQIQIDQVIAKVEELGMHPGYLVNFPSGPTGVYTASVYPDSISYERVVHIDQYSGKVLFDMGFSDLGALGQAAEWGISVHFGQEFGIVNLLVMLAACVAIVLMAVSALVMWWKRRPAGALGAPKPPSDWRAPKAVLLIAISLGVLFPLVGLSIFVMLLIDLLLPSQARWRVA